MLFFSFTITLPFYCSAAGGEIFNLCAPDRNHNISERQIIRLLRQIIEGVKFLHENNVVHLDLKVIES